MASRFWVGGTGTWNASNTTNWAATSGGAGGQSVPGTGDTVTFDASSGSSFTVTVESGYNPSVIALNGGLATITLNLNDQTLTVQTFIFTGTATRRVAFGSTGQIIITGNNALVFSCMIDTGLTFTGSRNVYFTYTGSVGTRNIRNCTLANIANCYLNMYITGGSDILNITGSSGLIGGNVDYGSYSGSWNAFGYYYGSLTLSPNMTIGPTALAASFLNPNGVTQTITTNGKTIDSPITVNCPTSTVVLADDLTLAATRTLTLTAGTLNFNDRVVNVPLFSSSGSSVRTLAFGNSTVNITGNSTTVWTTATATNMTVTGTKVVNLTYAGATGTRIISAGSPTEENAISFNITAGTDIVSPQSSMNNLDFTGFAGSLAAAGRNLYGNLIISPTMTVTAGSSSTTMVGTTGTRTITTNGVTYPQSIGFNGIGGSYLLADDLDMDNGSQFTTFTVSIGNVDLNNKTVSASTFSGSGSTARSIAFGSNSVINLSGNSTTVWSAATVTNFSYTGNARVNFTYAGATGNRTINHGSSLGSGVPATAPPPFYFASGSDNVVTTSSSQFGELDFAGFTGTLTNTARSLSGNLTLGTGMTAVAGANAVTFNAVSANQTLVTNGVATDFPITIASTNGNFVLGESLSISSRTLTLNSGNLIANGYNITAGVFSSSNGNPRIIDISNTTVTLTSSVDLATGIFNVWDMTTTTGATLNAADSNINLTSTTTANSSFLGGGFTYGNLDIGGATGGGNLTFNGNNTFVGTINSSKTVAYGIKFTAGTTTTVDGFTVSGSAGNVVTITSATAATHNLVFTGAGNVDFSYADISYSNASPTNTWYALLTNNNTDSGNNTGWIFELPATSSSNFFLVF